MSSPACSTAATEYAALAAAFAYVVEHSFFAFAEICDSRPPEEAWLPPLLRAAVSFSGAAQGGTVEIVLPESLACELGASFAGCESTELTPAMIRDATGELCNIVCGLWLTRGWPLEHFSLTPPCVAPSERQPPGSPWIALRINDVPASVRVVHGLAA